MGSFYVSDEDYSFKVDVLVPVILKILLSDSQTVVLARSLLASITITNPFQLSCEGS